MPNNREFQLPITMLYKIHNNATGLWLADWTPSDTKYYGLLQNLKPVWREKRDATAYTFEVAAFAVSRLPGDDLVVVPESLDRYVDRKPLIADQGQWLTVEDRERLCSRLRLSPMGCWFYHFAQCNDLCVGPINHADDGHGFTVPTSIERFATVMDAALSIDGVREDLKVESSSQ